MVKIPPWGAIGGLQDREILRRKGEKALLGGAEREIQENVVLLRGEKSRGRITAGVASKKKPGGRRKRRGRSPYQEKGSWDGRFTARETSRADPEREEFLVGK